MKKDTTTIKRILRQTDSTNLHGYFQNEDDFIISNGYSVILSDVNSNGDFIQDIENLNNAGHYDFKLFADYIKKNIEEQNKNGSETIEILADDLKMWKKHGEKGKPFIIPTKKGLMGVNPSYLLDLATLTRQDKNNTLIKIKVIDKKAPLYIDGNGVKALLCPVMVTDCTEKTYDNFKNKLADCYDLEKDAQEEKAAKKKNTSVLSLEKKAIYNGFTMWIGGKQYFLMSDKKRVTDEITKDFLKLIAANTTINVDKISESDFKYIKNGINSATITKTASYYGNEEIYRIETKYNSENFYKNEYDRLIIYNGNMEKIDILADDMSATDEETPKSATIQDNNADIVADPETTTAATTDTANNDSVTDTNNCKKVLHGFYMTFKNRDIFVATNEDMKRRYIVQAFISEMINISNHLKNITEGKRNNILNDEEVLKETKKRITPATIEEIWTRQENHIRITTNNGNTIINQSLNDFKTIMLDCYSANEGITPAQETALKFFKSISDINNRTTDTTTQDTTPTQDKPHKTRARAVSLFVVTDKPQPVKLYGANIPTLERIPTYTQRIISRLQPLKSHRVYNNRVSNKKVLKKAYNDFVGTVSMSCDKCAIGGKVAAGNTS